MSQQAIANRSLPPRITSAPAAASNTDQPLYVKMVDQARETFMQVCDEQVWLRESAFAMQIIAGNQYLQNVCKTPTGCQSIKNAIINVAMTGTTLNPVLKKAYLVPRSVNGMMLCCLDFSYQGLTGIAIDSGSVKHLSTSLVYTFDDFEYEVIDGEVKFRHRPSLNPPTDFHKPEKFWDYILCGYCVATLHDGTKQVFPPFLKWKLEKAMNTSKTTGTNTPWRTHPDEMSIKTIIKHEYKHLPQTQRMSQAVSVLNEHEGVETENDRRERAVNGADSAFNAPEDATYTEITPAVATPATVATAEPQAQPVRQDAPVKNEPMVDPIITVGQCEEIDRRIKEVGADYEQFLAFLGVKHLADVPQSKYGTAIAALESKRRQQESAAQKAAGVSQEDGLFGGSYDQSGGQQPSYTNAAITTALAAKGIMFQVNEETGAVFVKLNFNDGANKEFVKGLGFKWDPQGKNWWWAPAA